MMQHLHFTSQNNADWQWPLKVGLSKNSASLETALMQQKWPKKFVKLTVVPETSQVERHNLLFLVDVPSSADLRYIRYWSSDVVIVLRSPQSGITIQNAQFKELADQCRAVAVFYIEQDTATVANWFDNVIVNLSHNQDIVQAIENASASAILYYDEKIREQTTLVAFTKKLIEKLRSVYWNGRAIKLKTNFLGEFDGFGFELAQMLESRQDYFSYLRESGDASDLVEISNTMSDPYNFNYHRPNRPFTGKSEEFKDWGREPYGSTQGSNSGSKNYSPKNEGEERKEYKPQKGTFKKFGKPAEKKGEASKPPWGTNIPIFKKWFGKKAAPAQAEAAPADAARYLQAGIESDSHQLIDGALAPSKQYILSVQIGLPKKGFVHSETVFPDNIVFAEEKKLKAPIQLKVKTNLEADAYFAEINLPRTGDSETINFLFTTTATTKEFIADIQAYHKNRLIQQIQFTVLVSTKRVKKEEAQIVKTIFCARKSLSDLEERTAFTASLEIIPGKGEEASVQGMAENKPLDLFFAGGLKKHLTDMKDKIQAALGDEENHPANLEAKGNQDLMVYMAMKGSLIYQNHLRGKVAPKGPLQIISNDQSFLPVDFIYSYPPPDVDATLCPNAKDALKKGECCGTVKENEAIAKHVCPFGFWSCSRIIERHNYQKRSNSGNADYSIVSEPVKNRETLQILNNTLFGSSARVDRSGVGLIQSMLDAINKYKVKLAEAKDWDNWSVLIGKNKPDSLILVVHIEKDIRFDINKLEMGNKKFVLQTHIGPKVISREHLNPPPFVVMLGCESSEINNEGFDVASQLLNEGAAIVLSNFTRIQGTHARDIVINLVKFLEEEGKQVQSFGEIMLKLRRYLLSEGLLAGLILIAQGDADWKIKI